MEKIIQSELKIPKPSELSSNNKVDQVASKINIQDLKPENKTENNFLKNKIKRSNIRDDKKFSQRSILKTQLEFYFSDENLIHDKFLQKFLLKDKEKGVPLIIIEKFNKVKNILSDIQDLSKRLDIIRDAIESSIILKMNKKKDKIKRIKDFDLDEIDNIEMDERSVYVENLPNNINHDLLTSIFSRCGKVLHVSIPKFSDNKKTKGYGFVIFEKKEDAKKAICELNNKVPKELLSWNLNHPLRELNIFSKKHWVEKKEEFKRLKLLLQNENRELYMSCCKQTNDDVNQVREGTLIVLKDLPSLITKNEIKIWISHFVEPAYIDINALKNECVIRFSHPILADGFINIFKEQGKILLKNEIIKLYKLEGEEEKQYLQKVYRLQAEFAKNKKKNAKNLNKNN